MATMASNLPAPRSPKTGGGFLDPRQLSASLPGALRKLDPRTLWHNPVMLIVEIGAIFTTVLAISDSSVFAWLIVVWLWLTVLFANVAESVAEGRGKAQADALRRAKTDTFGRRLRDGGRDVGAECRTRPRTGAATKRSGGLRGRAMSSPGTAT